MFLLFLVHYHIFRHLICFLKRTLSGKFFLIKKFFHLINNISSIRIQEQMYFLSKFRKYYFPLHFQCYCRECQCYQKANWYSIFFLSLWKFFTYILFLVFWNVWHSMMWCFSKHSFGLWVNSFYLKYQDFEEVWGNFLVLVFWYFLPINSFCILFLEFLLARNSSLCVLRNFLVLLFVLKQFHSISFSVFSFWNI